MNESERREALLYTSRVRGGERETGRGGKGNGRRGREKKKEEKGRDRKGNGRRGREESSIYILGFKMNSISLKVEF